MATPSSWQAWGLPECTAKIAEAETAPARAPGAGVQNSGVFCARSASVGGGTRYFSPCLIFWCFWIKPKAQKKNFKRRKIFRSILREASRTFDWASPARSGFTTFCHQKVAPKVSAGHLRRDRTEVLTERAQKTALFCTPAPGARTAVRSDSSSGAMRNLRCAPRNDDLLRFEFLYTQI